MSSGRALLHRTTPRSTLALVAALLCTSACSSAKAPTPTSTSSAAPASTTPVDVCTSLVGYWVKEALRGNKWAGIDWEQKGLSNEQFGVHEKVLTEARAEQKRNGKAAAEQLADRRVREECKASNGATGSSENWRDPA
ncbi:hypothetical protein [Streptomyces sp. NPDC058657]|uniref:hypothetical protein n=1 Tax=unclassified Streptomyces TaxID=2593676 RepID=UPI0036610985